MLGCECSKLLLHKCAFIYPWGSAPGGSTLATLNAGVGRQTAPLGALDMRLFIQHRYHCRTSGGQREMVDEGAAPTLVDNTPVERGGGGADGSAWCSGCALIHPAQVPL